MSSSVSRSKKDLPQRIIIAGYYGHQNAGDEAILQGVLRELSELGRDLEFVVISANPEAVESLHGVRSIAWTDTKELIDTIRGAALVVVGGGGLIQDYWGVDPKSFMTRRQGGITEFGSPILLAKLLGVRCMFYTVGVGPLRSEDGRLYSRILFEAADGATVRDEGSRQLLQEIGVDTEGISIASDPAFRTSFPEVDQRFHTQLEDLPGPKIGVSLRYWNFGADPEEWGPQVSLALDQVVDAVAGTVVLVPMHLSDYILEDDLKVLMKVREDMQHRDRAILAPEWLDPIQRFFVMENFDLVLGMRLHSLIACLRAGVPCVGLQYDPKVKALLSGFGIEELCIDVSKLEAGALAERMLIAYMSKTVRFREIAEELREKLVNRSASAELADFLLDAKRPAKRFPPYLVDFAINQTLNLAEAEAQSAHLNQAIRKVWGARLGSTHPFEYTQTDLGWIVLQLEKDQERMASLEKDLKITQERLDISQSELMLKKQRLNETKVQLERERRSRAETEQALHEAQMEQAKLQDELDVIRNSRGYKLLSAVWGVLWRIRDPKQAAKEFRGGVDDRTRGFRDRTIRLSERIQFAILKVLPARYRNVAFVVRSYHLKLEDNSRVTLYTDDDELFPGYEPRRRLNGKNIV
ncbi:MAG: hypothetical protein GTO18_10825, partial [Anaerolineales bacterium]|nr:hypothetical protein [Anaerolineales bacterium]